MTPARPVGLVVIAVLAVVQAGAEVLWAARSIRAGQADVGRGLLILPLMGAMLVARGGVAAGIGLLYALFAWAALTGRRWARSAGLVAVLGSAFAVVVLVVARETPAQIVLRALIPVIVLVYLLTPPARRAFRPAERPRAKMP